MRRIGGRCQRAIRRCLRANVVASTAELLTWAYRGGSDDPRVRGNQRRALRHAAKRLAVAVGRSPTGKGRPVLWQLRQGESEDDH
jgi:hypothetical protein